MPYKVWLDRFDTICAIYYIGRNSFKKLKNFEKNVKFATF